MHILLLDVLKSGVGFDVSHLELLVTIISALAASSGFWLYFAKRSERMTDRDKLLMGLAHDRIIYLGLKYIERGSISQDEFENLHQYLYTPYINMGGNGSAKRLMDEVSKLPIKKTIPVNTLGD